MKQYTLLWFIDTFSKIVSMKVFNDMNSLFDFYTKNLKDTKLISADKNGYVWFAEKENQNCYEKRTTYNNTR